MQKCKLYLCIVILLCVIYYLYNNNKPVKQSLKVYWFYKPGCPHCDEMKEEWVAVEKKLSGSLIDVIKINTSDSKYDSFKKNFKVSTVPQITKVKPNGLRYNFNGKRKAEDIVGWIYGDDIV
jgi:thiol-disulfide isomerase/thioredoxin